MTRTPRTGPRRPCPHCRGSLDAGPVVYHCSGCSRAVYAADLDFEYVPPRHATA
ncbi:hypothetical protein [Bailinhaonella thermotolerans]|uniref:hypothetical protein n=1 Tax=Bailinhaonella thermotolerans TaxID=1070861 RepID=UPI00192A53D4|nr:hypothetical protein [Bailinhaonella thermotolerans]